MSYSTLNKAGATQSTYTTIDAVDPKKPDGVQMSVVWGNPNKGASQTFKGAAPQTGGPGSVWSQRARQVHDDKCEEGGDCIVVAYFHGKLDFNPVNGGTKVSHRGGAKGDH